MSDACGQATLAVVLALGIAATAIVGLRSAQDRVVAATHSQRAGEAAIEAAAQSVADAYAAHPAAAKDLVVDPRVLESARVAAEQLARENGENGVEQVQLSCIGGRIEAWLVLNGYSHHAGFGAPECSRH
jgi:pyruvate/2-oxoglutarate dehydrogenase complex dihydrolipoamide acyltransferase (E2) component